MRTSDLVNTPNAEINLAFPKRMDLGDFLKISGWCTILHIYWTEYDMRRLTLFPRLGGSQYVNSYCWKLICHYAQDFAIRPPHPATIIGGPFVKLLTQDPRLDDVRLKYVPGGDGMRHRPRKKFKLLVLDQTWVIAERFEIERIESDPDVNQKS